MHDTTAVDLAKGADLRVVSAKIPRSWLGLLDSASNRRGDDSKSETIRDLIRAEIEAHFPGSTKDAA